MPDHRENNAVSSSSNASPDNLEDAMWRLKVDDHDKDGVDANQTPYPDRPGAPDCIFYLRTGLCGYASNCRYNHPTYNGQMRASNWNLGTQDRGELPERVGQPDCQYFLKTGTCKYGASCKYHHPRDRYDAQPISLNILGFPMRQDEKYCPYYMRTGSCKFGVACKFNHPQPANFGSVYPTTGASGYGPPCSSLTHPSSLPLIGGLSTWPLARPYLTSPRMQGLPAYMPVILPSSQSALPMQQGWSTYMGSMSQLQSAEVTGPMQTPNTMQHAQSGPGTSANLPERLDQPECQYYMKTGSCKYGTTCKYHHPKERYTESPLTLGPLGLPLRPGHDICTYYSMYGSCRFGAACKYDHPLMGFYNYAMPALPLADTPALYPMNQRTLPQATWPPPMTETPTVKTANLPARLKKSGQTNGPEAKAVSDNSNSNDDPPPTLATSPSTNIAPSSDSQQNHSD